jgi:hypothetical protein
VGVWSYYSQYAGSYVRKASAQSAMWQTDYGLL